MQTPTQAADLQAAVKKALHSASFSKFVTSAVQLALADEQAKPQGVVLPDPRGRCLARYFEGKVARRIDAESACGRHSHYLQASYRPSTTDLLGIWYGAETRKDSAGREWSAHLPNHVVDDFGTLVPVGVAA